MKKHVSRMLAKVGARDRIQAVIVAYDRGPGRATILNTPDKEVPFAADG
ncbi:hypothetical protein QF037_001541 [Streptomyces canus]|nr:hypothetical protein [Streptomyces canus]MDQ0597196.1 hypothetical protein [Streptomyces canus]